MWCLNCYIISSVLHICQLNETSYFLVLLMSSLYTFIKLGLHNLINIESRKYLPSLSQTKSTFQFLFKIIFYYQLFSVGGPNCSSQFHILYSNYLMLWITDCCWWLRYHNNIVCGRRIPCSEPECATLRCWAHSVTWHQLWSLIWLSWVYRPRHLTPHHQLQSDSRTVHFIWHQLVTAASTHHLQLPTYFCQLMKIIFEES